jgi:hypothetical protein
MSDTHHTLSAHCRAFTAALALTAATGTSHAAIVLSSYNETANSFEAIFAFTPDITPLDAEITGLGNWTATLTQTYIPGIPLISSAQYTFAWAGAHLATPHPGELPLLLADLGTCTIGAGSLTGTFCDTTTQIPHLDLDNLLYQHYDEYHFWLELVSGGGYAYLTGTHVGEVPVPAAAWLFGSGLAGLMAAGRRKRGSIRG